MKRIRTLIIMAAIICLSIGSFYIYAAAAAKEYPQFYIKKESGNEKEISSLILSGSVDAGGISEPVTIAATGSQYNSHLSFMERFNSLFSSNDGLDRYRQEYRSFMRGKHNLPSFYEDSRTLIFTGVDYKLTNQGMRNCTFTISQLNKKSRAESSFQVKVPQKVNYHFISITDVQIHGRQLDVITTNSVSGIQSGSSDTEIHRYRFDLKQQKLLSDKMIFSTPDTEDNNQNSVYNLNSTRAAAPENYYLFTKDSSPVPQEGDNGETPESVHHEIYAYHFATDAVQKIPFPQEASGKYVPKTSAYYYHGPIIYSTAADANGVKVIAYNIETNKVAKKYAISIDEMTEKTDTTTEIKNNRIYLLLVNHDLSGNTDIRTNYIAVADLKNGKLLYKGKVIPKATKKSSTLINASSLYIQAMNLN